MSTEIVILGGGYAGVEAARKVLASSTDGDRRVTVVSATTAHAFHGWTAEVITGHVHPDRALTPLADLLPGARLLHATVEHVDLERQEVRISGADGERSIRFDELIISVGSRDARDRIPGLREHGWSLKDEGGLDALTHHLSEVVARAATDLDPAERRRQLTVVVAGGGFAGIESATAIAQRLRAAVLAAPGLEDAKPRVVLVHSGAALLPGLRPRFRRLADYATRQAMAAGVEVLPQRRLTEVDADGAALQDGSRLEAATVLSTIGQRSIALPGTETLARDASGRLVTDRTLRVAPHVWAGGDAAAVPHPSGRGACPTNALWAIYHGRRAGANVARILRGSRPAPFRFPGLGQGASFGVGRGAAELYGITLTGWPAWLARWGFFHWFMPSRTVAWQTAREWILHPEPSLRREFSFIGHSQISPTEAS